VSQQKLIPLDALVLEGFERRFQQVFNCPCAFINQNDRTKILERLFGQGNPLTYPYAWFVIQSVSHNVDSYNSHPLGRRGIVFNVGAKDTYQTVRILPVNIEVEVNYVTPKFESVDQGSVLSFIRRWLLARRFGYLKSSINYGSLKLGIGMTLNETVPVPQRENITESETKYDVQAQLTIHGYVSEPVVSQTGKINQLNVNEGVQLPNGKVVSIQTLSFDPNQEQPTVPTGRNLTRVNARKSTGQ
jgi:hypothetical protein